MPDHVRILLPLELLRVPLLRCLYSFSSSALILLFLYSPLLSTLAAIFLYLQSPVSKIQKKNSVPPRSQTRYLSSSYSVHVNTSTRLKPSICIITPQDLWVGSGLLSGGFALALAFILIFLFYFSLHLPLLICSTIDCLNMHPCLLPAAVL